MNIIRLLCQITNLNDHAGAMDSAVQPYASQSAPSLRA